jgi:hypothetical protein
VDILHSFGLAFGMEINWHKSMAYWWSSGVLLSWVENYQWKWVANGYLFKLLDIPFGLEIKLHDVDHFIVVSIKAKLERWSSTHLSFVGITLIVNQVLMLSLRYFIAVWDGANKVLRKIKAMLRDDLW